MVVGRVIPRRIMPKQIFDYLLVVDFEATCERNAKIQPFQEIIEFPVAKLNTRSLEVESIFHKYVRPTARPELSTFCSDLTGIIQEMVDREEPIDHVLNSFDNWIKGEKLNEHSFSFVSCGDWDLKIMLRSEAFNKNIHLPEYFSTWINVKKSFCELTGSFPKGMKDILKHMDTPLQGRQHSGIDDVKNIVEITKWLIRQGHVLTPHSKESTRRFG